jgi:hypothetical protein
MLAVTCIFGNTDGAFYAAGLRPGDAAGDP